MVVPRHRVRTLERRLHDRVRYRQPDRFVLAALAREKPVGHRDLSTPSVAQWAPPFASTPTVTIGVLATPPSGGLVPRRDPRSCRFRNETDSLWRESLLFVSRSLAAKLVILATAPEAAWLGVSFQWPVGDGIHRRKGP